MIQKLWAKIKTRIARATSTTYSEVTFNYRGQMFKKVIRNGVVIEDSFATMTPEQKEAHYQVMASIAEIHDIFAAHDGEQK